MSNGASIGGIRRRWKSRREIIQTECNGFPRRLLLLYLLYPLFGVLGRCRKVSLPTNFPPVLPFIYLFALSGVRVSPCCLKISLLTNFTPVLTFIYLFGLSVVCGSPCIHKVFLLTNLTSVLAFVYFLLLVMIYFLYILIVVSFMGLFSYARMSSLGRYSLHHAAKSVAIGAIQSRFPPGLISPHSRVLISR